MKLIFTCITTLLLAPLPALQAQEHWTFLDNGHVRLGVNMDAGGSIGWFSHSRSSDNVLNAYDHGRYVQQSYYGDRDGSDWNGKPWRYNPVQGGSWKGVPARIIEKTETQDAIYTKTQPRHWATGKEVDDLVMEQWFKLESGLAQLKYRMTYRGQATHAATHQELPALFVNPRYDTLIFCEQGTPAWSNGQLTRKQPGFPNETVRFSEPWAVWADAQGQGLGIYFPHTQIATTYRVRDTGVGDCSYLAPLQTFPLKPGLVCEYETVLALGTAEQVRAVFRQLHEQKAGTK